MQTIARERALDSHTITRREALKRAAALVGGTLAAAELGALSRIAAAMSEDAAPRFLGQEQFRVLQQVAGLMIPETDTPGAVGARVHTFIDLMLAEWASPARQARWVAGLDDIDRRAREAGQGFCESPPERQLAVLQALDDEAFAQGSADHFFRELKRMILFGYYSSETGASIELGTQRIPGDYEPCLPLDEVGRAWFWNGFSYEL
jgi:hypothetical protein